MVDDRIVQLFKTCQNAVWPLDIDGLSSPTCTSVPSAVGGLGGVHSRLEDPIHVDIDEIAVKMPAEVGVSCWAATKHENAWCVFIKVFEIR